jgi:ankyrin repeat protein/truncated hemoglobin YjbI
VVDALYDRIAVDPLLKHVFPHPESEHSRGMVAAFLGKWLGGDTAYSDGAGPGLHRRHQALFVSPRGAGAWLRCMTEALRACGVKPEPVMEQLGPIAAALVHDADVDPSTLRMTCDGVQPPRAMALARVLAEAARGNAAAVRRALRDDPGLGNAQGTEGRSLAWVAVRKNRPVVLEAVLAEGGDPNLAGCEPLHMDLACASVRPGTMVMVTPLALARRSRPGLVAVLEAGGAVDDVFTAAWLGDRDAVASALDACPGLVNAADPADDFQDVTPLCHAVCGGDARTVALLLERGAEVAPHSGKLLTFAAALNRPDLVATLLDRGADARRVDTLGPLDPEERPIADLLVARGKGVPEAMLARACRADVSRNEVHRARVLLDYGADVNALGREGLTALHYAVRSGKLPLIRLLIERGADVNAPDHEGRSPAAHIAESRARLDPVAVLDVLVRRGAALDGADRAGEALLRHFSRRGDARTVKWLVAHGVKSAKMASNVPET